MSVLIVSSVLQNAINKNIPYIYEEGLVLMNLPSFFLAIKNFEAKKGYIHFEELIEMLIAEYKSPSKTIKEGFNLFFLEDSTVKRIVPVTIHIENFEGKQYSAIEFF